MKVVGEGQQRRRKKNYTGLRKELKTRQRQGKEGILESICDEIMGFQRTGVYDLMYMKQKK
jgi:hypothetical protein